jgi:hypothetical protein
VSCVTCFFFFQYSELSLTSYPTLAKTVFTIFMILVPILLLNMLIAMMGNTYAHVIEQSEKEWMKQVCVFVILKFLWLMCDV